MLTIYNRKTSLRKPKVLVFPVDKWIADFQFVLQDCNIVG